MILEYAQLLCTAHRVLDGTEMPIVKNGRNVKSWKLNDERNDILYVATHINHPSAIWVRESNNNYNWLYSLFLELCKEYEYRYGKVHKCFTMLASTLKTLPINIAVGYFTPPTPAMPDEYKIGKSVQDYYHAYYNGAKRDIANWKKRDVPVWFKLAA